MVSARRVGMNENIATYGNGTRAFTSVAVWESSTDNNLFADQVSEILECYADEVSFDDHATLSGAITSSDYFRIVRPAGTIGEEDWQGHDGTPNSGVVFASTVATNVFAILEDNSMIQDVVMELTYDEAGSKNIAALQGDEVAFIGCIAAFSHNLNTGNGNGFIRHIGSGNAYFIDCLSLANDGFGFSLQTGTTYLYNCVSVLNGEEGFEQTGGTVVAKNCLGNGNEGGDFTGTFDGTSVTNASGDATAPGSGSRVSQTFTFVDTDNQDYHLDSSDEGAKDFGTDLSADGVFPFDDDVDGDLWGTWDIGFDESGVEGPTPDHTYQHQYIDVGNVGFHRSWSN